jgi:hypothetical protein
LNWRRCRRRWRRDEAGQVRASIGRAGLLASLQLLSPHHQGRKEIWLMPGCCHNRRIACCHSVLFAFALMSVQYRFRSCPRFVPYVSPHFTSQNTASTRCCARQGVAVTRKQWRGGQKHVCKHFVSVQFVNNAPFGTFISRRRAAACRQIVPLKALLLRRFYIFRQRHRAPGCHGAHRQARKRRAAGNFLQ